MPKKTPKKPDTADSKIDIPPTPMCIPLTLDGEDVLLLSSTSVAQWKASLGPKKFEDRFTNVLDVRGQQVGDRTRGEWKN